MHLLASSGLVFLVRFRALAVTVAVAETEPVTVAGTVIEATEVALVPVRREKKE